MKTFAVYFCFVLLIGAIMANPVIRFVEKKGTQSIDGQTKLVI